MPLNIFSVILIGIILYQAKRKSIDRYFLFIFQLTIFTYLSINIGYFIDVGGLKIDYYRFLLYYSGFLASYCNFKGKIKQKDTLYYILLLICIISSYIIGAIEGYEIVSRESGGWDSYLFGQYNEMEVSFGTTNIKMICDLLSIIMISLYIKSNFDLEMWRISLNKVASWLKWIVLYGVLEAFVVYILRFDDIMAQLLEIIFGRGDSTYTTALSRGVGFQLQGMFREPAQYARGLFICCILFFVVYTMNKRRNLRLWMLLSVILMILSMSFTSLLLLPTMFTLYILYKCKKNPRLQPIIIGIGVFFLYCYLLGGYTY